MAAAGAAGIGEADTDTMRSNILTKSPVRMLLVCMIIGVVVRLRRTQLGINDTFLGLTFIHHDNAPVALPLYSLRHLTIVRL